MNSLPKSGRRGEGMLGKKIPDVQARKPAATMTTKAAAGKMAEMMTRKVSKTQMMREQKSKTAKYR